MTGVHPASSVPRRRRFRWRCTQNGRTLVAAVRTFHALRLTPSPPLTSPRGLSTSAHFQPTATPAFSHYCEVFTRSGARPLPPRGAMWALKLCSLSIHDEPCLLPEGRHRVGRGSSRRWPPRGCLGLPLSGTRVSLTFFPLTSGAAGGVPAREQRPHLERVTFDGDVKLWNGPFWLRKSTVPGSGHFRR